MKKFLKVFIIFLITSILISTNSLSALALKPKVVVNTESTVINQFYYGSKTIYIRRITANRIPVFCLDINLDYPHGETFELSRKEHDPIINNILSLSYPNKDLANLGITDADDGYFITQTLLWCYLNGFDINKVYCDNDVVERALRTIYNNSQLSATAYIGDYYVLKTNNNNIQSVIFALPINTDKVEDLTDSNEDTDIKDIIDDNNNFLGK